MAVLARRPGGDWRITALEPPAPGLRVPSEGGAGIGTATLGTWLAALGVGAILTIVSLAVMALAGRRPSLQGQGSFGTR